MDYLNIEFFVFIAIITGVIYYLHKIFSALEVLLRAINEQQLTSPIVKEHTPTSYELQRLAREEKFDERIDTLKEELAKQNPSSYHSSPAEILHPLIENLPHDSVKTKYDLYPEMEVAE